MSGIRSMTVRKWREKRPAVAVAIPMNWSLHRDAVISYLSLFRRLRDDDVSLLTSETAVVSFARNNIVKRFLDLDPPVEYLLMIDDDIVVDPAVIEKLTIHQRPIISGVYYKKSEPFDPVVYLSKPAEGGEALGNNLFGTHDTDYHAVHTEVDKGLFKVDGVGAGCLMVRRDVLARMEPPWFKFEGSGEDLYFCRKAKALGYDILIDTSMQLGHVGVRTVTREDYDATRDNGDLMTVAELHSIAS